MVKSFRSNPAFQAALVAAGFLVVYIITISHNLAASHDSIGYINEIDEGSWLFHPHHLLYHPICILWVKLFRGIGVTTDSSLIVASLNSLFGAMTTGVLYYILVRFFRSERKTALATVGLIGFSFGVWFYSDCVEVYIIPIFFLSLGFIYLLKRPLSTRDILMLGMLHGVATLFHQSYLLVGFAVLARLWFTECEPGISRMKATTLYLIPSCTIVIGAYLSVIIWNVHARSFGEGWWWLTGYAHSLSDAWNVPSLHSLFKAFIGFTHAFMGGHFLFAIIWFREHFTKWLPGHELDDEYFLVRNLSQSVAFVLAACTAVLTFGCLWLVVRSPGSIRKIYRAERNLLLPTLVWLATFSIFFFIWDPSNLEFWIPQTILVWILLNRLFSWCYGNSAKAKRWILIAPAIIIAVNYLGDIRFLVRASDDYFYAKTQTISAGVPPGRILVSGHPWILDGYCQRFLKYRVYGTDDLYGDEYGKDALRQHARQDINDTLESGKSVAMTFDPDSLDISNPSNASFQTFWRGIVSPYTILKRDTTLSDERFHFFRAEQHRVYSIK